MTTDMALAETAGRASLHPEGRAVRRRLRYRELSNRAVWQLPAEGCVWEGTALSAFTGGLSSPAGSRSLWLRAGLIATLGASGPLRLD